MSLRAKILVVIIFHIQLYEVVLGCACVPEEQKLAFGDIARADVYCREKYARALKFSNINSTDEEYKAVYGESGVDFTINNNCYKTQKGDSFSLAWYCGEYCSRLCEGTTETSCEYVATADVCKEHMHCVCRANNQVKCMEKVMADSVTRMFNHTCLNCYFMNLGDQHRPCISTWGELYEKSKKCSVGKYGLRMDEPILHDNEEATFDWVTYSKRHLKNNMIQ